MAEQAAVDREQSWQTFQQGSDHGAAEAQADKRQHQDSESGRGLVDDIFKQADKQPSVRGGVATSKGKGAKKQGIALSLPRAKQQPQMQRTLAFMPKGS